MKRLLAVGLLLAGTIIVSGQDTMIFGDWRPDAPALASRGEYGVGVRTLTFTHADQVDIVNATSRDDAPRYDRPLTVEIWYPGATQNDFPITTYNETLGRVDDPNMPLVPFTFQGRAERDIPIYDWGRDPGSYPLIVVSHGWPGSRYMMTYLTENLASKGFVVVAIDHTESTFSDVNGFASTLLNRPLDVRFVIDEIARLNAEEDSFLQGLVDTENVGLIGYSMGGYGVLNVAGGGYGKAYLPTLSQFGFTGADLLAVNVAGNEAYTPDERVKAVYAFAPWGMNFNLWDKESLATLDVPVFFVGGSEDDVSGYANGPHRIFELATNAERYFLTFEGARHNVAPNPPPPALTYGKDQFSTEIMTYAQYMRYADSVWDSFRMNNINQHFATAFFEKYLNGADTDQYLDLIEVAADGVYALNPDGTPKANHTYWAGFQERSAVGLRFEHLKAGE